MSKKNRHKMSENFQSENDQEKEVLNALMLVNRTGERQQLQLSGVDMEHAQIHVIDDKRLLSMAFEADSIGDNTVLLIEW